MKRLILMLASGCGLGYLPIAPGTWGSLLGIPLAYALSLLSLPIALLSLVAFVFFSIWVSDQAEKIYQKKDASYIVIDEICGMAITLFWLPLNIQTIVVGFILFRIFDVIKIPPARWIDKRLGGGAGVVLDDVVVAIYGRILMGLALYLNWLG